MRTGGGTADAAVGMMDGAYFVSKTTILDFFNNLLDMNLTKIEMTATGAVACQLTELIFPGSIPMSRVNWGARAGHEFVANYKLLQAAFTKNRVRRHVDVDRLIRAKYQDNLEFCQWLKAFYEQSPPPPREGYDPAAVRAKGKGGKSLPPQFKPRKGGAASRRSSSLSASAAMSGTPARGVPSSSSSFAKSTPRERTAETLPPGSGTGAVLPPSSAKRAAVEAARAGGPSGLPPAGRTSVGGAHHHAKENVGPNSAAAARESSCGSIGKADNAAATELAKKNAELTARTAELELRLERAEQERDFYFEKLRGIEAMVVGGGGDGGGNDEGSARVLVDRIGKVLGASTDDDPLVGDGGEWLGGGGGEGALSSAAAAEDLLRDEIFADGGSDEMDLSLIEA